MTIEQLFAQTAALSLYVNNLFQRHDGRWQANLRDNSECYEFGRGDTPVEALTCAIEKAKKSLGTISSIDSLME